VVPPVEFDVEVNGRHYHEQHYDGGVIAMTFLRLGPDLEPRAEDELARPSLLAGSNLYVLVNRKLCPEPAPVPKRALCRTIVGLTTMFESITRSDIAHLDSLCTESGMNFHLLAVPEKYRDEAMGMCDLCPSETRPLFEIGYQAGAGGPPWRLTPPRSDSG
jgi:hypothetical protein